MSRRDDKLYYPGTNEPLALGDRISLLRWFRRQEATIVYLPGESPRNQHLESKDGSFCHWCYRLDSETHPKGICMVAYFPPNDVVPRSLRLIRRATANDEIGFVQPSDEYC